MSFDPRMLTVEPFVPHDLATLTRAYPAGTINAAIHEHTAKRLARIEDVSTHRIRYAVDDVEVTGVMLQPKNWQPGNHPILMFNRGGNREYGIVATPLILRYMMPFAQQGYLVFASNYRGNDGGTGREEFGGADRADVLTLLDIAQHHPGWDGKNSFMLGASRGGMMTYLAIKDGAKLNAAATFGGVSTMDSEHRPELRDQVYAQLIPGFAEDPDQHIASRSAVRWPEALARVPLLMGHGDADEAVLAEQSQTLAEQLAAIGAPHKLVVYPGGNHPLSTHLEPWLAEITTWFNAHRVA